jgi:hypothetical protein
MTQQPTVSPAAAQAARMIERQRDLAMELDSVLAQCSAARVKFEAHAAEMEALIRQLARGIGFDNSVFEYLGGERLRRWIRDRGVDAGFGPIEARHLEGLKHKLETVTEATNAAAR